jgi:hypothetical protein
MGNNAIVENTHLFEDHQQKHYTAQLTQHQIKVIRKDILHRVQPILHGHPIKMRQSTSTTLVFAQLHNAYEKFNLNKPKLVIICEPYKVAMLKHVRYRPVPQDDLEALAYHIIIISITSKQWGARADFGRCMTYQGDIIHNTLGSGASTVMTTSSYNNHTQADLQALQVALLFLQMHLKHVWHHQMQF